jgi:hypothetical protein
LFSIFFPDGVGIVCGYYKLLFRLLIEYQSSVDPPISGENLLFKNPFDNEGAAPLAILLTKEKIRTLCHLSYFIDLAILCTIFLF